MYICIYESFFERVRTCFHAFRKKQERTKKDGEIGSFRAYIQLKISKDVGV